MKYTAVIYDLDGTLLDSRADIVATTKATIAHRGGKAPADETICHYVGKGLMDLVRRSLGDVSDAELKTAVDFFNAYYAAHCVDKSVLYHGASALVSDLKSRNIKQAIFTNKPQVFTDQILKGLGVHHLFDFVHGGENGHAHKPDVNTTRYVLDSLGVTAEQTLMIGDSSVDFYTAKNIGMDCVLLYHGFSTREEILCFKDEVVAVCEDLFEVRESFILHH